MARARICPKCANINDASFLRCKFCSAAIDKAEVIEGSNEDIREAAEHIKLCAEAALDSDNKAAEMVNHMLLTTGYDFQGYRITQYFDVVFDELFIGMGLLKAISVTFNNIGAAIMGDEATKVGEKLNEVKTALRDRVKLKAAKMGANALIGIDFESSKVGDLIMVSMTATAVKVEKLQ